MVLQHQRNLLFLQQLLHIQLEMVAAEVGLHIPFEMEADELGALLHTLSRVRVAGFQNSPLQLAGLLTTPYVSSRSCTYKRSVAKVYQYVNTPAKTKGTSRKR